MSEDEITVTGGNLTVEELVDGTDISPSSVETGSITSKTTNTDAFTGGVANNEAKITSLLGRALTVENGSLTVDSSKVKEDIGALSEEKIRSIISSEHNDDSSPTAGYDSGGTVEKPADALDVTMHGVKNDGSECCSGAIESLASDGETLWFPEGEYLVKSRTPLSGTKNLSLVQSDKAKFVVEGGEDAFTGHKRWGRIMFTSSSDNPAENLELKNFTVDWTGENVGNGIAALKVTGDCLVEDITVEGEYDYEGPARSLFNICPMDPHTKVTVRRTYIPDGSIHQGALKDGQYDDQPVPFIVPRHAKENSIVRFEDCVVNGFPNNSLYASKGGSSIQVIGGFWWNSDHSIIRIGGTNSVVRDAIVGVDDNVDETYETCKNIWLRHGTNHTVENCKIFRLTDKVESPAVQVHGNAGAAHIENNHIHAHLAAWSNPIQVHDASNSKFRTGFDGDNRVTIKGNLIAWDSRGRNRSGIRTEREDTIVEGNSFKGNLEGNDGGAAAVDFNTTGDGVGAHRSVARDNISLGGLGLMYRVEADDVRLFGGPEVERRVEKGDRTVTNLHSTNEGDPNETGEWKDHGVTGVTVHDTTDSYSPYTWIDGWWRDMY